MTSVACNQASQNTTASPSSSALPSASARATGSAAASASAGASAKYIELQVIAPESNARAGIDGVGWTVDVIAKGSGPAMDAIKPAFTQGGSPGKNTAFPGLVVLLKSTSAGGQAGSADQNLAKLFQMIGLPNTNAGIAGISSVNTSSASPAATSTSTTGTTGATGASATPAGTAATRSTTSADNQTAEATWFVQQTLWGSDVDVELTVFVVEGDAPDRVTDRSSLRIVSNEVTVRFHINGGGTTTGTAKPSGSAAPSASPSGSARPSASPTSTP